MNGIPTDLQRRWLGASSCVEGSVQYTAQSRFREASSEYIDWHDHNYEVSTPSCP